MPVATLVAEAPCAQPAIGADPWQDWTIDIDWIARFEAMLGDIDTVSFDVFDTAITRLVDSPVDVFARVEQVLRERHGEAAIGFALAREEAERLAHRRRPAARDDVTLEEIYDFLPRTLPTAVHWHTEAMAAELAAEAETCRGVPDILKAWRLARVAGRRVIFVSDMYLPADRIADLLQGAGYSDWDDLFVSSETGRSKASGRQWEVVARRCGPLPRILHVGDDHANDVTLPAARGLQVLPFTRTRSERRLVGPLSPAHLPQSRAARHASLKRRASAEAEARMEDFWSGLGSGLGALLVGSFVAWLAERARAMGIEHLYFCARDGWLLHQAWENSGLADRTGIRASYLYVSRRTLGLAGGHAQSTGHCLSRPLTDVLTTLFTPETLEALLARAGVAADGPLAREAADRFGGPLQWLATRDDMHVLRTLFERHAPEVLAALTPLRAATTGYLKQEGLFGVRRCGLVDLGWGGTFQAAIQVLSRAERTPIELAGFYYGLHPGACGRRPVAGWMEGFLANDFEAQSEHRELWDATQILEELHSGPHGAVLGYQRQGCRWYPQFSLSWLDLAQHARQVRHFQTGTLRAVRALFEQGYDGALRRSDLSAEAARAALMQVFLSPSLEERCAIGSLCHADNFHHAGAIEMLPEISPQAPDEMERLLALRSWKTGLLLHWRDTAGGLPRQHVRNAACHHLGGMHPRVLRQFED